jgi:gamma-glutamyltranspeptidase/glutathione hydrolase
MSPTIILSAGRPELVVGAAGGPRIINATLQTIVNFLDFKMPVKQAVDSARIHHQWMPERLSIEARIEAEPKKSLEQRGHAIREQNALGVVQAITWDGTTMTGAADPRKVDRARTE